MLTMPLPMIISRLFQSPAPLSRDQQRRVIARMKRITRLMDGSNRSIVGLDPLIGLVPILGDILTTLVSLYLVWQARRLGVSGRKIGMMLGNVAIDLVAGVVPIVGDYADFMIRANRRNLRLIGIDPDQSGTDDVASLRR